MISWEKYSGQFTEIRLGIQIASLAVITPQVTEFINHISKHRTTSINVLLETNQGQADSVTFCQFYFELTWGKAEMLGHSLYLLNLSSYILLHNVITILICKFPLK